MLLRFCARVKARFSSTGTRFKKVVFETYNPYIKKFVFAALHRQPIVFAALQRQPRTALLIYIFFGRRSQKQSTILHKLLNITTPRRMRRSFQNSRI